ncbi:MAG TPA: FAD-dependent oxidoreductase [Streptosporangiales bacterium]
MTVGSGERISADYTVIATGSTYPFPAKFEAVDSDAVRARLHETRAALADATRVLLLGAGPVGLELAGEMTAAWPDKRVTLLDRNADVLSGRFPPELRAEIRAQLAAMGVELVLGAPLREEPPSDPGEPKSFTLSTTAGVEVAADIWFRCYGVTPVSGFLATDLAGAREPSGQLAVTPELRLRGHDRVFAVGDVTAVPEAKMAKSAGIHADVVAANITRLSRGGTALRTYRPAPEAISLPLGPHGGASYAPGRGLLDAAETSRLKGRSLRLDSYRRLLGLV